MFAAALGVMGGCAAELPPPDELDDQARNFSVNVGWGCHTCEFKNSPHLGKHALTEFTVGNKPFAGFTLKAIENANGQRFPVGVNVHRLEAYTPSGVQHGAALTNWKLIFVRKGVEQPVRILVYEQHPDWVDGALIDTYGLGYHDLSQGPEAPLENVCPGLSLEDTTIVFTPGETYVDATKTVVPGQTDLVTVACRGHAVAKLKFLGHDPNDSYGSAPENRQAALKMVTADYCGDGTSYTKVGQPLDWADELGLFSLGWSPADDDLEARWDENGALCLNNPRNKDYKHDDIACPIDWCAPPADDLDGARWATYHAP